LIEDVHQKRSSLEDMFIQLIGSPEVKRAEVQ
jgi:hypothetical protein